jgi:DNA recombination protein RmuC
MMMNTELIMIIVTACLVSILFGFIVAIKLLPSILKSLFRDTAEDVLSNVSEGVKDEQRLNENNITQMFDKINSELFAARSIWKENTSNINQEIRALSRSHTQWIEALSNPIEQGALAEEGLEIMLQSAGLVKGISFDTQVTEITNNGERIRPDFYVYTPDDGVIIIDSKAPISLYREAIETEDPIQKKAKLYRHATSVLNHAVALGARNYSQEIGRITPDNVIMYMPNLAMYLSACEQIPDLIQRAWAHKITIAPPEAMFPILKNIMLTWQQKKLHENADKIQKQAKVIHSRLKKFHSYFAKIGKSMDAAVTAFNQGSNSWERRLSPAFKKMEELGVSDILNQIPDSQQIEGQTVESENNEKLD